MTIVPHSTRPRPGRTGCQTRSEARHPDRQRLRFAFDGAPRYVAVPLEAPLLTHVVLFRFPDLATAHEARVRLLAMEGQVPTLLSIEAGVDVTRSDRSHELALITRHADRDGLTAYAAHPVHGEVLAWLREHMVSAAAVDFVS